LCCRMSAYRRSVGQTGVAESATPKHDQWSGERWGGSEGRAVKEMERGSPCLVDLRAIKPAVLALDLGCLHTVLV
jgi:hypothetical protein